MRLHRFVRMRAEEVGCPILTRMADAMEAEFDFFDQSVEREYVYTLIKDLVRVLEYMESKHHEA